DHRRRAGFGLKFGFEDQRAGTIAAFRTKGRVLWGDEPAPVVGFTEQRGKAGGRVETWPAQPVDRAVAADQSRGFAVAYHRIVFNWKCHGLSLAQSGIGDANQLAIPKSTSGRSVATRFMSQIAFAVGICGPSEDRDLKSSGSFSSRLATARRSFRVW